MPSHSDYELLGFLRIHGRRFLAYDVLSGLERRDCHREMFGGRGDDRDQVDVALDQCSPVIERLQVELLRRVACSFRTAAGDAYHVQSRLAKGRNLRLRTPARSDDSNSCHTLSSVDGHFGSDWVTGG